MKNPEHDTDPEHDTETHRFTIEGKGDPFLAAHLLEQAGIDVQHLTWDERPSESNDEA
jgi:hypothetical protein